MITLKNNLGGDFGIDIPVAYDSQESNIIPEFRLRAGLNLRF
jgi:hypothetical protein